MPCKSCAERAKMRAEQRAKLRERTQAAQRVSPPRDPSGSPADVRSKATDS